MKIKSLFIFITFWFAFSCVTHLPFSSAKSKRESIKNIKDYIHFNKNEFNSIKNNDSILYEMSLSIEKEMDSKLIKRRLDSFLLNSYSKKEFLHMLKLDRVSNGWVFELDRNADESKLLKIDSFEELEVFMKKMDSSFSGKNRIKIKSDTLSPKD
ncbi:hypothetical protein CLV86_1215 [Lacinutrix venerupis]|uniref:hypothetical protein n=1 Tax=Lacinutrix venerupis TaxID=1486034 RepID=UPI000EB1D168|nr:hypothetical protein [Lacinutrix venerupis]RLJ65638.1 hypothetical protein CLV86_1215 [Lacinutrix venerupis]